MSASIKKKLPRGPWELTQHSKSNPQVRGQELLEHIKKEWQIKMMVVSFFAADKKGFKFHAQPQTGTYSCL